MKKIVALMGMSILLATSAQAMYVEGATPSTSTDGVMTMATTAVDDGMMHTVNAHMLNVRHGAGVTHPIENVLHKGDMVKIMEKTGNMKWCHVSSSALNDSGWVYCNYLSGASSSTDSEVTITVSHMMEATKNLNVRSSAMMGNNRIDNIKKGEMVTVLDHPANGQWCKIQLKNYKKAYVSCQYLK